MADPVFDPVNVPNRVDPTAKPIDNVQVTDSSGAKKDRQVIAPGDPFDASGVARVLAKDPANWDYGSVVRVAGSVVIAPTYVFTEILRELKAIRLGMEELTRRPLGLEVGTVEDDAQVQ